MAALFADTLKQRSGTTALEVLKRVEKASSERPEIATEFERLTGLDRAEAGEMRTSAEVAELFGSLFYVEWKQQRLQIEDLLDRLDADQYQGLSLNARLNGLAMLLAESDPKTVLRSFARCAALRDPQARAMVGRITWTKALPKIAATWERHEAEELFRSIRESSGLLFVRPCGLAAEILGYIVANTPFSEELPRLLLDKAYLQDPKPWLDTHVLGRRLLDGKLLGLPGAVKAFARLVRAPEDHPGTAHAALAQKGGAGQARTTPEASRVLTLAVLKAYMDDRDRAIASEEQADHAIQLFTLYLDHIKQIEVPVSFWTPAQQLACAKWLHHEHDHSAAYIARLFNVMRSAFIDATKVKLRRDPAGGQIEGALIAAAPEIVARQEAVADHLSIPARKPRRRTLSLEDMARVLDAIETEHLFRFAILSLCTWARPEAITDFDAERQVDWHGLTLNLAPPDWRPTKKRRSLQPLTQCVADWLQAWTQADQRQAAEDLAAGLRPKAPALLTYKRERVATTKKAWRRIGVDLGLDGFTQKSFRHFMATNADCSSGAFPGSSGRAGWAMWCATARARPDTMRGTTRWRSRT